MRMPATNQDRRVSLFPVSLTDFSDPQPIDHLDLGLVGDVLLTDKLLDQPLRTDACNRHDALWRPLSACSLVIANLEAPITEREVPAESKPYNLKTSRRVLDVFDSRFVLNLANNHTMDYGPDGLLDTMEALDAAGLAYTGAGANLDHARVPRHVSIAGVDVAVIGAADPRFYPATASTPGTFPAIPEMLVEAVLTARLRAQLVAVSIHMGLEHVHIPSVSQIHLAEECLAAGARLVHFHHSHCLSGSASDGRGIVLFGTGNYVFPSLSKLDVPRSKRTAVWRARYSKQKDAIVALGIEPAVIDRAGMPCPVEPRVAERERETIRHYSQRMLAPVWRQFWRLHDMLRPSFLLFNIYNYATLLKRRGPVFVWRSLVAGLKVHRM